MHRTALFFSLASFLRYASASFGFTSANFDYVQLSSAQVIACRCQFLGPLFLFLLSLKLSLWSQCSKCLSGHAYLLPKHTREVQEVY
jgi:hypothetical protein